MARKHLSMDALNDTFVFVVEYGTRKCAKMQGLTRAAVENRITRLEKTIGAKLFHDDPGRTGFSEATLTEFGEIYYDQVLFE